MNRIILILFLFLSIVGLSQDKSEVINGEWFSCYKRDFNIGDTIKLERDSCIINYEHNGNQFQIQVVFEFDNNHFSIYKESEVIAGASWFSYWEVNNENTILIGDDQFGIIEKYQILNMNNREMTLIKMK